MNRDELVKDVRNMLVKTGFSSSDPSFLQHAGFDLVARRDRLIMILKILTNVDSVDRQGMASMVALARAVEGTPIIIGLKMASAAMEDGVVYSRYGIPAFTRNTLFDLFVEGVPPMVYSAPGGLYVRLDSDVLREMREKGMSLGELAEVAGVSRRTIQMYEDGMGAKLEAAIRLEEHLGIELINPIDPLSISQKYYEGSLDMDGAVVPDMMKAIFEQLHDMGYSVQLTNRCPFDALTSDRRNLLFTGVGQLDSHIKRRARVMANISKLLERKSVFFVERRKGRVSLEGTPLIEYSELGTIHEKKKIIQIIDDRGSD